MNISIISVFPDLYTHFLKTSLIRRAQENKLIHVDVDAFFSFVKPKERIDAPIFGPGAGMLIRPDVVERAIDAKEQRFGTAFKVFFSPAGQRLDQRTVQYIADASQKKGHLMLLPARYEGMDARVEDYYADIVISIGDFVLMGGDLAAKLLLESVLRLVPGVVGKAESVVEESFTGPFVEYPHYTVPVAWKGKEVPEVLRSGNHAAIEQWRMHQAAQKTVHEHFAWLRSQYMDKEQLSLARTYIPPHYCVLLHDDVLIGEQRNIGTTSVTSLDIHDIARSAMTYGLKNFFIVTPLNDQQQIVKKLLDFWLTKGETYNAQRAAAIQRVKLCLSLADVVTAIEEREGVKPLIIATSAREIKHQAQITFFDQAKVWAQKRPVLFIFGTGKGLAEHVLEHSDFLLPPITGFSDFCHLSVRSAAAIVFDRWLGINRKDL